jgi:hypothetical protein
MKHWIVSIIRYYNVYFLHYRTHTFSPIFTTKYDILIIHGTGYQIFAYYRYLCIYLQDVLVFKSADQAKLDCLQFCSVCEEVEVRRTWGHGSEGSSDMYRFVILRGYIFIYASLLLSFTLFRQQHQRHQGTGHHSFRTGTIQHCLCQVP